MQHRADIDEVYSQDSKEVFLSMLFIMVASRQSGGERKRQDYSSR
jgi:hypothetical protein